MDKDKVNQEIILQHRELKRLHKNLITEDKTSFKKKFGDVNSINLKDVAKAILHCQHTIELYRIR